MKLRHALIFLLFFLTGCGFHLRGHDTSICLIKSVYIKSPDPYGSLVKTITSMLKSQGATVAQAPGNATYLLEISAGEKAIQSSGFGLSNQVSVNTLTYSMSYRLLSHTGEVLIPSRLISSVRTFTINTNQALMGNVIPDSLVKTMQRDISNQLLDQLNTWKLNENQTRPAQ